MTDTQTLAAAREAFAYHGIGCHIRHYREGRKPGAFGSGDWVTARMPKYDLVRLGYEVLPCGGVTEVLLNNISSNETLGYGLAACHPKDNFNRRRGAIIAIGRAVRDMQDRWEAAIVQAAEEAGCEDDCAACAIIAEEAVHPYGITEADKAEFWKTDT